MLGIYRYNRFHEKLVWLSAQEMKLVTAIWVLAIVTGCNALTNETAVTESVIISSMPPSAFVYNPIASNSLMVCAFHVPLFCSLSIALNHSTTTNACIADQQGIVLKAETW